MLQERTIYLPVNWIDGMSINKTHFIALDNNLTNMVIDATGQHINEINYGLLPGNKENQPILIDIDSNQVLHVRIRNLRAITLCGARIEITPDTNPLLELSGDLTGIFTDNEENVFAIILTIDPYTRVPVGNSDPEENPPRKPFIIPSYKLNLLPVNEIENSEMGLFHLTLGMIIFKNGEYSIDNNYIPPCTSINSHFALQNFCFQTENKFIELEQYIVKIIRKIHGKNQQNALAFTIKNISENILSFLCNTLPSFNLHLKHQPPVYLIEQVAKLAHILHNNIETWQGNGKEEVINYFIEWCNLNQGMFDQTIKDLAQLKYKHHAIAESINRATIFLSIIIPLFKHLSELDYIGKKIDTSIFVTEENSMPETYIEQEQSQKKNWFKRI